MRALLWYLSGARIAVGSVRVNPVGNGGQSLDSFSLSSALALLLPRPLINGGVSVLVPRRLSAPAFRCVGIWY